METAGESRAIWLLSCDGKGSYFSAGLLQGYEQDRTVHLPWAKEVESSNNNEDAEMKPARKAKAKAKSVSSRHASTSSSSSAADPTAARVSAALYENKYIGTKLAFFSYAHKGVLVTGIFCAEQEAAVLTAVGRLVVASSSSSPVEDEDTHISGEALHSAFELDLSGVFAFVVVFAGECWVIQRLVRGCKCQAAALTAAASYRMVDLFVPPPLEQGTELAALCEAFWIGASSIVPAAQTRLHLSGAQATSTVFLRRELFFALDRYIGTSTDEGRRIIFAITNESCSALEVNGVFPKLSPAAVEAFRSTNDEAGLTATAGGPFSGKKQSKPKGYMAAFNIYVQDVRAKVVKEREIKKLSNNEVNKVLGARWNALSSTDRKPYEELAELDKVRYMNDIREYNASAFEHVAPRLKGEGGLSSHQFRQSTAYAQFTHQDRAFISQASTTQYCNYLKYLSSRWQNITPQEREIYESMSLLIGRLTPITQHTSAVDTSSNTGKATVVEQDVDVEDADTEKAARKKMKVDHV